MSNKEVKLKERPKDENFEDYVASIYQSSGMYVEKRIKEENIVELDVITTNYTPAENDDPPQSTLIEAKSGKRWHLKDIFKVDGWRNYMEDVQNAAIISLEEVDRIRKRNKVADELEIGLIFIDDPKDQKSTSIKITGHEVEPLDTSMWRFAYKVERAMLRKVRHQSKSSTDNERFESIINFYERIHNDVFLTSKVTSRVDKLYDTYGDYENLGSRVGNEMKNGEFEDTGQIPTDIFKSTFFGNENNELQLTSLVEHKARLKLLKAAVDYVAYRNAGRTDKAGPGSVIIDGKEIEIPAAFRTTFQNAVRELQQRPYYHRYPIFWQWFLGIFGGFLITSYLDKDLSIMSSKTGIPEDRIYEALKFFNILFPTQNGWSRQPTEDYEILYLYPSPMRGIGVNYRTALYTESGDIVDLNVSKRTKDHFIGYNNSSVEVIDELEHYS